MFDNPVSSHLRFVQMAIVIGIEFVEQALCQPHINPPHLAQLSAGSIGVSLMHGSMMVQFGLVLSMVVRAQFELH